MRVSTMPLSWPALCTHVRRPWLRDHRGELPAPPGSAALDAPLPIAAMAQFGQRHSFATEAEAETYRYVGPRALNAVMAWSALRYEREDCRISIGSVRYWERRAGPSCGIQDQAAVLQADICREELRQRWARYWAGTRRYGRLRRWVRDALSPLPAPAAEALQAAE